MDFSKYIFRSHMVGKIINVPKPLTKKQVELLEAYELRSTGEGRALTSKQQNELISLKHKYNESLVYKLSDSTKKLLSKLAYAERYGRKKSINSDKLTKGIEVEKASRDLLSRVTGLFLVASTERKTNDFVTGAIDIEPDNVIIDIKSSWSWESFSEILENSANETYLRQGDSYMDLWGKKDFLLCHVLVDTPNKLVEKELKSLDYRSDILDFEGNVKESAKEEVVQVISNHIFSKSGLNSFLEYSTMVEPEWFEEFKEIPEEERVHMIPHKYDPIRINQRNSCIKMAREYMNKVTPINNFNKKLIY